MTRINLNRILRTVWKMTKNVPLLRSRFVVLSLVYHSQSYAWTLFVSRLNFAVIRRDKTCMNRMFLHTTNRCIYRTNIIRYIEKFSFSSDKHCSSVSDDFDWPACSVLSKWRLSLSKANKGFSAGARVTRSVLLSDQNGMLFYVFVPQGFEHDHQGSPASQSVRSNQPLDSDRHDSHLNLSGKV